MPGQLGIAAEENVLNIYALLQGSEALGITSSTAAAVTFKLISQ